jgi:hypothetical protein
LQSLPRRHRSQARKTEQPITMAERLQADIDASFLQSVHRRQGSRDR